MMSGAKTPRSLRAGAQETSVHDNFQSGSTLEIGGVYKVSAVAGLIAVASLSGAEAQQSPLPPVTVDAPVVRPRPAAPRSSAARRPA